LQSITAPAVLRKGLPGIIDILSSLGISNTTKSVNIKQLLPLEQEDPHIYQYE
jgi:hypothetical protein